uniref:Sema domain-containing protein n=1 Tax=Ditylenchus dipsaci TaxID=166011 RepID=A0A915ETP6_9BILA
MEEEDDQQQPTTSSMTPSASMWSFDQRPKRRAGLSQRSRPNLSSSNVPCHSEIAGSGLILPHSKIFTRQKRSLKRYCPSSLLLVLALLSSSILFNATPAVAKYSQPVNVEPDPSILATFRDVHDGKEVELEKMIMDRSTSRLYVGGVNHLYDISPDALAIREHAITGPRPDSVLCADALGGCKEPLTPTNSYTKALAIYPDSNKLIECTSLYQGRCRTRNLSNIRRETDVKSSRPGIVANDQTSSTVVFVGSGPVTSGSSLAAVAAALSSGSSADLLSSAGTSAGAGPRVLYVGSTYAPVSGLRDARDALDVPAVASLSLEQGKLFDFTSQSISSGTFMKLDRRMLYRIEYVGGFEANGLPTLPPVNPNTLQPKGNPSSPNWSEYAVKTQFLQLH